MTRPWPALPAGPITVLTRPTDMWTIVRRMRTLAAHHDDTAWLHPRPNAERRPVPTLSQDLLDAIGAVGLATPRLTGEKHLLRPLTHLVHGHVRHLVIDDASLIPTWVLTEMHQATLLASVQLWLIIDTADQPSARGTGGTREQYVSDMLDWVHATSSLMRPTELLDAWSHRPTATPHCQPPDHAWWHTPIASPFPTACADHANTDDISTARVACLLAGLRRALTAGTTSAAAGRARLIELTDHPQTTIADRWALTAAGRDLYNPGIDALTQTHPKAHLATLRDIAVDGSAVRVGSQLVPVDPMRRPAVARLRTSRHLAGALLAEPVAGIFDSEPGAHSGRR